MRWRNGIRFERSDLSLNQQLCLANTGFYLSLWYWKPAHRLSCRTYQTERIPGNQVYPKDTSLVSSPSSEATLLKNLNHPGIPIIYDIEEDEHFFYIIEEFIQGQSIDTFVSYQKISHELLIKFGIQLCDIFRLSASFNAISNPISGSKTRAYYGMWKSDKINRFWNCIFFRFWEKIIKFTEQWIFFAPEALNESSVTPSADVYGLRKVLQYLSNYTTEPCSTIFQTIIQKATAYDATDRYETVRLLKKLLNRI